MVDRISLSHLTFVGATVEPATVDFGTATTVIRGPSDTGKSFIVSAIDFMLGGGRELNDIPERVGYSTALLGVRLASGDNITLSRSVDGSSLGLYEGDLRTLPDTPPSISLGFKHKEGDEETLSGYLLAKIGLDGKRVRKNVSNQTNSLSFRNLVNLCVIDETRMQSETSPALSGIPTNKTVEISTLKLLLENQDDSALIAVPNARDRKQTSLARTGIIDRLIADLEVQLEGSASRIDLQEQVTRLDASTSSYTASISELSAERAELNGRITTTERRRAELRNRVDDIRALDSRFQLLQQQYVSDLSRLDMIAEAGSLLGYFNPGQCVFCGAEPEHQHYNEDCADDTTAFRESVEREQAKTANLNLDLQATLNDLASEQLTLVRQLDSMTAAIADARRRLTAFDERLRPDQGTLKELLDSRAGVRQKARSVRSNRPTSGAKVSARARARKRGRDSSRRDAARHSKRLFG